MILLILPRKQVQITYTLSWNWSLIFCSRETKGLWLKIWRTNSKRSLSMIVQWLKKAHLTKKEDGKHLNAKHLSDQSQGLLCIFVLLVEMEPIIKWVSDTYDAVQSVISHLSWFYNYYYLRNLPTSAGQCSEPLLSNGLSPLSLRFFDLLHPAFPEFTRTRMHFELGSGPSTVSVTRNLNFSLTKLWIAWIVVQENPHEMPKDNVDK